MPTEIGWRPADSNLGGFEGVNDQNPFPVQLYDANGSLVSLGTEVASFFGASNVSVAVAVKASSGYLMSVYVNNKNAAVRFLQIHNKASAPVSGDVPVAGGIYEIAAGSATVPATLILDDAFFGPGGMSLGLGIAIGISTTGATFTAATTTDHVVAGRFV